MMRFRSVSAVVTGAMLIVVGGPASGQVITAPDGRTRISFDGDGTGQASEVRMIGYDHVAEMLWYEATTTSGMLSTRVENLYNPVSETITSTTALFTLERADGALHLEVLVRALNGDRASFDLTWTNIDQNGRAFEVRPFLYTDVDPAGLSGGELLSYYDNRRFEWFGGPGYGAVLWIESQSQTYAGFEGRVATDLRDALDAGRSTLQNGIFGPRDSDWTAAVMGDAMVLEHGQSHTIGWDWHAFPLPGPGAWVALLAGLAVPGGRRRRR